MSLDHIQTTFLCENLFYIDNFSECKISIHTDHFYLISFSFTHFNAQTKIEIHAAPNICDSVKMFRRFSTERHGKIYNPEEKTTTINWFDWISSTLLIKHDKQATEENTTEQKFEQTIACEHDKHLNATDGTVQFSKCSPYRSVTVTLLVVVTVLLLLLLLLLALSVVAVYARSIIFQSECIECCRLCVPRTHIHASVCVTQLVCQLLIWRTVLLGWNHCLAEIRTELVRLYVAHDWILMHRHTQTHRDIYILRAPNDTDKVRKTHNIQYVPML